MKTKFAVFLLALFGAGGSAFAQGYRLDSQISQELLTTQITNATNVLTIPSSPAVSFCAFPANAVPCTNKATTYTSVTLGTPCATSTQITLTNTNTCVASPDSAGNWGAWVASGQYSYTITIAGLNYGPYVVNFGVPAGTALTLGATTVTSLNNIVYADQQTGADPCVKVNAAVALLPTGGGIVDARGFQGNFACSVEMDIGNVSSKPITLLTPNQGTWTATMTGGTFDVLKVFNKSQVIGYGSGEGQPFTFSAGASSNLDSVCGTTATTSQYVRMEGFACNAVAGATVANAVLHIQGLNDESYVGHITATTASTTANKILWVHASCCSATIEMINAEGFGTAGAIPCTFGSTSGDAIQGLKVRSLSCVHPGSGLHNFVDNQNNVGHVGNSFDNIYMEVITGGDLVTSFAAITSTTASSTADTFNGLLGSVDLGGSSRYVLDIASGGLAIVNNLNMGTVSTNAINDHNGAGKTLTAAVATTIGSYNTTTLPLYFGPTTAFGSSRATAQISDQGSVCTNGELVLSAGWQSTGTATVTAVAGNGQTCSWTITTGTTTGAAPTVTDTLTNALPAATTVCELNIHGGTHTAVAGEGFTQTTLSATAPIFTFIGTPGAAGVTYFVTRRCGP